MLWCDGGAGAGAAEKTGMILENALSRSKYRV